MTDQTKDLRTAEDWFQFLRNAQAKALGLTRDEYEKWGSLTDVTDQQSFLRAHSKGFESL